MWGKIPKPYLGSARKHATELVMYAVSVRGEVQSPCYLSATIGMTCPFLIDLKCIFFICFTFYILLSIAVVFYLSVL